MASKLPAPPSPSPSLQQLSLQLRQDLAKLVDKDPHTRRSALDALKAFIEGALDASSMPCFLEQVSGESSKGDPSRPFAISLFVEVARVHKEMTVPFIPRIMATVVRSLSYSAGSQNLHQACAKVVSAVARYAIEPHSAQTQCDEVLGSLCHPLLGVLCSKVETVAVGAATCVQALVESEKWKFAAPALVSELSHRAAATLGDKGTQTIAHMHLVRSLAKFNTAAIQDYGALLLKAGVHILQASNGGSCSWQQRAAAAQLLASLLGAVDERTLASELVATMEALERGRLDKVTVVRQAVGEALHLAKALASNIDHLLQGNSSQEALPPPRRPSGPKKRGRRRSLWTAEDESPLSKDGVSGSQESQLVFYSSPPSAPSSPVGSGSPSSTASSGVKIGRSPLYPAKQSPALLPSPNDRFTAETELEYILAHLKSSESKENAPLMGKSAEPLMPLKSDDLKGSKEYGESDAATGVLGDYSSDIEQVRCDLFSDDPLELLQASKTDLDIEMKANHVSSFRNQNTDTTFQRSGSEVSGAFLKESDQENCLDHLMAFEASEVSDAGAKREMRCSQGDGGSDQDSLLMSNSRYNSLAHLVNLEEAVSPKVTKTRMTAEDFLLFATPRRLVRSLQSASSTPESKCTPEADSKEEVEIDFETLSESGWSVRDNPIAGDSEDDSPRKSGLLKRCSLKGSTSDSAEDTGLHSRSSENDGNVSPSAYSSGSLLEAPGRCHQVQDTGMLEDANQLIPKGQRHGTCCHDFHEDTISMQSEAAALSNAQNAQATASKGKGENWPLRWLRRMDVRECSVFTRRLSHINHYMEMFLGSALFAVLLFSLAVAVLNCLNGQRDVHALVPT